jgi:hypothetical protein
VKTATASPILILESCNIPHDLGIIDSIIHGYVTLMGASAKTINFGGTHIVDQDLGGSSLVADRMSTSGSLFLRNDFSASGTVRLSGASIGGNLTCKGGSFNGKMFRSTAIRLKTTGSVFLDDGFAASGTVRLVGAIIGGHLDCSGGSFNGNDVSIDCQDATISGSYFLRRVQTFAGQLDLYRRTLGAINSDQESWAKVSSLILDGATYESFSGDLSGRDAKWWIGWLAKQPEDHRTSDFKPQPYEQLAKVLRSMGHETEAKEILIEKRRLQRQVRWKYPEHYPRPKAIWRKPFWYLAQCWDWFLQWIVGYGYKPFRAFAALAGIMLVGWGVYTHAASKGVMTPTNPLLYLNKDIAKSCSGNWVKNSSPSKDNTFDCKKLMPPEYTPFHPLIYSIDVGIPLVEFKQEADWSPRVTKPAYGHPDTLGVWVRRFQYFQIISGWVLSLLFVSAVSGIIRKD